MNLRTMIPSSLMLRIFLILLVGTCYFLILSFFNVFDSKITIQKYLFKNTSKREHSAAIKVETLGSLNQTASFNGSMKYILMWTYNHTYPFIFLKNGQEAFISEHCPYTNCYVTNQRTFLKDLTEWDAILFHGPEFTWRWNEHGFPDKRASNQKYVFTSIESAANYPSCDPQFDNYFNWTWTYKVDSDVRWGYMGIRDIQTGEIIGPKSKMDWIKDMDDLSQEKKEKLKTKTKAAAWFVSNCYTKSHREDFANRLQKSLDRYHYNIDVYGVCGNIKCERDSEECWEIIEHDYFFYLSFENSFCEDYVTEKFLHAMKHGAVPIVWGGADYNRFAPPKSYINAREIGDPDQLADLMHYLMTNPDEYSAYFKWTKYYTYQRDVETPDTHAFCLMCKALNDPEMISKSKTYTDFNKWWNGASDEC